MLISLKKARLVICLNFQRNNFCDTITKKTLLNKRLFLCNDGIGCFEDASIFSMVFASNQILFHNDLFTCRNRIFSSIFNKPLHLTPDSLHEHCDDSSVKFFGIHIVLLKFLQSEHSYCDTDEDIF